MIPVNRDTLMLAATIVCAMGIIFLFKEMNKTKEEMNSFKTFSSQIVKHLSAPVEQKPTEEPEPEPEIETEAPRVKVAQKEEK
jgi:hypothetical protein|tara:strand:+ start:320 stop:568 length:249 start_codon:yes stop_codon:yes gene_type:complete